MNKKVKKQSYIALFNVLNNFYNQTKNDSLGALLGSMNPYLFENTDSADSAVFDDFCDCLNEYFNKTSIADVQTAYSASIKFLMLYRDSFGFEIDNIIQQLAYENYLREFDLINGEIYE